MMGEVGNREQAIGNRKQLIGDPPKSPCNKSEASSGFPHGTKSEATSGLPLFKGDGRGI